MLARSVSGENLIKIFIHRHELATSRAFPKVVLICPAIPLDINYPLLNGCQFLRVDE